MPCLQEALSSSDDEHAPLNPRAQKFHVWPVPQAAPAGSQPLHGKSVPQLVPAIPQQYHCMLAPQDYLTPSQPLHGVPVSQASPARLDPHWQPQPALAGFPLDAEPATQPQYFIDSLGHRLDTQPAGQPEHHVQHLAAPDFPVSLPSDRHRLQQRDNFTAPFSMEEEPEVMDWCSAAMQAQAMPEAIHHSSVGITEHACHFEQMQQPLPAPQSAQIPMAGAAWGAMERQVDMSQAGMRGAAMSWDPMTLHSSAVQDFPQDPAKQTSPCMEAAAIPLAEQGSVPSDAGAQPAEQRAMQQRALQGAELQSKPQEAPAAQQADALRQVGMRQQAAGKGNTHGKTGAKRKREADADHAALAEEHSGTAAEEELRGTGTAEAPGLPQPPMAVSLNGKACTTSPGAFRAPALWVWHMRSAGLFLVNSGGTQTIDDSDFLCSSAINVAVVTLLDHVMQAPSEQSSANRERAQRSTRCPQWPGRRPKSLARMGCYSRAPSTTCSRILLFACWTCASSARCAVCHHFPHLLCSPHHCLAALAREMPASCAVSPIPASAALNPCMVSPLCMPEDGVGAFCAGHWLAEALPQEGQHAGCGQQGRAAGVRAGRGCGHVGGPAPAPAAPVQQRRPLPPGLGPRPVPVLPVHSGGKASPMPLPSLPHGLFTFSLPPLGCMA